MKYFLRTLLRIATFFAGLVATAIVLQLTDPNNKPTFFLIVGGLALSTTGLWVAINQRRQLSDFTWRLASWLIFIILVAIMRVQVEYRGQPFWNLTSLYGFILPMIITLAIAVSIGLIAGRLLRNYWRPALQ